MCEADAFFLKNGMEELIMESVDIVEPDGHHTWKLISIFGDQKIVKGRITGMKLVDHKILFEREPDYD